MSSSKDVHTDVMTCLCCYKMWGLLSSLTLKPASSLRISLFLLQLRLCFHILLKIYPGEDKDRKTLTVSFCSPNKALFLGRCRQTTESKASQSRAILWLEPKGCTQIPSEKYVLNHLSLIYNLLVLSAAECKINWMKNIILISRHDS